MGGGGRVNTKKYRCVLTSTRGRREEARRRGGEAAREDELLAESDTGFPLLLRDERASTAKGTQLRDKPGRDPTC